MTTFTVCNSELGPQLIMVPFVKEGDHGQSTKKEEHLVVGLDVAAPPTTDRIFKDDGGAEQFCNFLAKHQNRILEEALKVWGDMSSRQRAKFAPADDFDYNMATGSENNGDERGCHDDKAYSNYLKMYQLRYGDVFTDEEISDVTQRQWGQMTPAERAQKSQVLPKRTCPKPKKTMWSAKKIQKPKPWSAKKTQKPKPA